jgi:hypothetical protein
MHGERDDRNGTPTSGGPTPEIHRTIGSGVAAPSARGSEAP